MSRPKGSKNKRSAKPTTDITAHIADQNALIEAIANERGQIVASIADQKQQLKAKTKELKVAQKKLAKLQEQKETADAIAKAAEQKAQIEAVVSKLVNSGKSADDILAMLAK